MILITVYVLGFIIFIGAHCTVQLQLDMNGVEFVRMESPPLVEPANYESN